MPFKNEIDYNKLCISIHISQINELEKRLISVTQDEYNTMFEYYNQVKHLFELEGMSNQIIKENM